MDKLTPKQEIFCREYIIDLNAAQAAIRAGYSHKTARQIATQLLSKLYIQKQIRSLMDKRAKKLDITAEYVLGTIQETIERCKGLSGDDKFEANAILKGTELLGKHLKLFTDKVDLDTKQEISLSTTDKEIIERFINKTKGAKN
jgi:phage terminase small subunit